MDINIRNEQFGEETATIVTVTAEDIRWDGTDMRGFEQRMRELLPGSKHDANVLSLIVLDLRGVNYFDSHSTGYIVSFHKLVKEKGKHVKFILPESWLRVVKVARLDDLLDLVIEGTDETMATGPTKG